MQKICALKWANRRSTIRANAAKSAASSWAALGNTHAIVANSCVVKAPGHRAATLANVATNASSQTAKLCVLKSCGRLSAATARTAFANAQASLARSRALKLRRRHCRPRQRRKKHYIGWEASFCRTRRGRKEHRTRLGRPGIWLPLQSYLISGRVAAISSGCRSPGPLGMKPKGFELRAFWGDGA